MYIHSVSALSTLPIIRTNEPLPELGPQAGLAVVEPKYADYIPPMQLRRMSKGLKMGLWAALDCVKQHEASAEDLQGIVIGTAYGLLKDSEAFLANMTAQNETALNPTAFIQSTHNTVSGAIAVLLKAHVHNMTFVQKGHSFDNALVDADLCLGGAGQSKYVLLGAVDERNDLLEWLVGNANSASGLGESASFMLVGAHAQGAIAQIAHYATFKTNSVKEAKEHIVVFQRQSDGNTSEDLVLWSSHQKKYKEMIDVDIDLSPVVGYNPSGSGFAMIVAAKLCQERKRPVTVVNQFRSFWSLYRLKPLDIGEGV